MRRFVLLAALALAACSNSDPLKRPPEPVPMPTAVINFSTYLGDDLADVARDVALDSAGNLFVVGGAQSEDLLPGAPVTPHAGEEDVFVAKLDASGQVVWWTFLGGPGPDRGYAIEVDANDDVVIAGGAADQFPVTAGVLLTEFQGGEGLGDPDDPARDGFVAKLDGADGTLLWATYFGSGTFEADVSTTSTPDFNDDADPRTSIVRDIALDPLTADIYLVFSVRGPSVRFPDDPQIPDDLGAFVRNLPPVILAALQSGAHPDSPSRSAAGSSGSGIDGILAKLAPDGDALAWATYVGGTGDEGTAASVRLDSQGNAVVLFSTESDLRITSEDPVSKVPQTTEPIVTTGAYDELRIGSDLYAAKYAMDGSLLWATYVGGNGAEGVESGNLAIRGDDALVIAASTTSTDMVAINAPAFDSTFNGANAGSGFFGGDCFLALVAPDADVQIGTTYYGGAFGDGCAGVALDSQDRIYVTGGTSSPDLPIRNGPLQAELPGPRTAFLAVFSADLTDLLHSGYFGGTDTGNSYSLLLPPGSDTPTTGRALFVGGASTGYPLTPAPGTPARSDVTAPPEHGVVTDLTVDLVAP